MDRLPELKRMINRIAFKMVPQQEREDAISDGMVCVWQLQDKFVEGQGSLFNPWMAQRIRWAMINGLRDRNKSKRVTQVEMYSLDFEYSAEDGQSTLLDTLEAGPATDPEQRYVDKEAVLEVMAGLSVEEHKMVIALLGGMSLRDYGKLAGVTEGRICQRMKKIRDRHYDKSPA